MQVHADNESNDSDKPKPKLLGEFLNDDDPPEVRRRYGQLPLMQSQHETTEAEFLQYLPSRPKTMWLLAAVCISFDA